MPRRPNKTARVKPQKPPKKVVPLDPVPFDLPRPEFAVAQIKLRLREPLRRQLERAAKNHRVSLNSEIRFRLEDSFENKDAPRALDAIQESMRVVWDRYSNRVMQVNLEEDFVRKVLESTDTTVVAFANSWLIHHARERELERKWKELPELKRLQPSPLAATQEEVEATMRAAKPRTWPKATKRRPR